MHFSIVVKGNNVVYRVGESCKEKSVCFLGHWVYEHLTWKHNLMKLQRKLISSDYALTTAKYSVPLRIRKTIYRTLFECHLQFG